MGCTVYNDIFIVHNIIGLKVTFYKTIDIFVAVLLVICPLLHLL